MGDAEKMMIRSGIFGLLMQEDDRLVGEIISVIGIIARQDFPDRWYDFSISVSFLILLQAGFAPAHPAHSITAWSPPSYWFNGANCSLIYFSQCS